MRRQTANQTLTRLAKDLSSHPFLLFLAFLGIIAQVALSIYLPILIGQVIDQVLVAESSLVFWQIFSNSFQELGLGNGVEGRSRII